MKKGFIALVHYNFGSRIGATRGPYNADFPEGTRVQIVDRGHLEKSKRTWRYHHSLSELQLAYPGRVAEVTSVDFYHGGDELYSLAGIPGTWHECCRVSAISSTDTNVHNKLQSGPQPGYK